MTYPPTLEIQPLSTVPTAAVRVPGSKSITNRAFVLGALGAGRTPCELRGALRSEDTEVMADSLRRLGFDVRTFWEEAEPRVVLGPTADDRFIPAATAELFVANSGTTMRFLTAMLGLGRGRYRLDGVPRMRERPIEDLLDALRQLGVDARSEAGNGCPPVVLTGTGMTGGEVSVRADVSSQFLSGLMMAAPFSDTGVTIHVDGALVSEPYVTMTVAMLRRWGKTVETPAGRTFFIPGRQFGGVSRYDIEPDASAASYFLGAAAVTGGTVTVTGLTDDSLQGDVRFADVLAAMGCAVTKGPAGITVRGGALNGVDVDMNGISDTVMTLGAVACFADGPTTIRNVGHIRHKETDRLSALAAELRRVGAGVEEFADGLTVTPARLHGGLIQTYHDHRMAMSLALVGLRVPGVVIDNPACVAKTYPRFFEDLARLG